MKSPNQTKDPVETNLQTKKSQANKNTFNQTNILKHYGARHLEILIIIIIMMICDLCGVCERRLVIIRVN